MTGSIDAGAVRAQRPLVSKLGWSTADRVFVYGHDLIDLLGDIDLAGVAFLAVTGKKPDAATARVFNAMIVSLVEHGQTPSTIAARLTYLGAPESMQGAIAAGLLGLGSVFVGTIEGAAEMVATAVRRLGDDTDAALADLATQIVTEMREAKSQIPGLGHPKHKPVDPRAERLFEIASEEQLFGVHARLMRQICTEAQRQYERTLPVNVTGAIGALVCDLGLPPKISRGLGVAARSIGLIAHLLEEMQQPMAAEIWYRVDEEVSAKLQRPAAAPPATG